MKLKYYLRGLGIGIIITVIIMTITSSGNLTDEEIIKRAEQLGMVMKEEGSSLGVESELTDSKGQLVEKPSVNEGQIGEEASDSEEQPGEEASDSEEQPGEEASDSEEQPGEEASDSEEQPGEEPSDNEEQPGEEPSDNEEQPGEEPSDSESQPGEEASDSEDMTGEVTDRRENVKYVEVEVRPGDSCYKVAKKAYAAGLVDNVDEFNAFLKEKGIDKLIRVGVYAIPEDVTFEELAGIFTKRIRY